MPRTAKGAITLAEHEPRSRARRRLGALVVLAIRGIA